MKKLILALSLALMLGLAFAQPYAADLFFSEYVEGSSNNKAIEIFNGTGVAVDLSQYTVKLASNGGAWSTTNIITPTGTVAHNDVFVIANSAANAAILAQSDVTSTVTYFNGDDALGLFHGETLIDIIGVYQNDPGTAWPVAGVADATLNHTLIRKPTVIQGSLDWAVSAGTNADDSQWIVQAIDYITDLGVHTFTPGGGNNTATPTFNPAGGTYSSPQSITISCSTPAAVIYYTTDGSTPTLTSPVYSTPLTISATTTLKAIAKAPALAASYVATAVYTFPVTVSTLSALRSSQADNTTLYYLTAEVYLSFKQTFRNQKYFQDDQAGILVDDVAGVITTPLNVGDGVEGMLGKLSEFGGMLQFIPTANITSVTSTENPIIPVVISYTNLIDNFDTYESRVVKVMNVSFNAPTGNFANGISYPSYDPNDDFPIRTTFYDVDYINTPVPTTPMHISGIPNSRVDGSYFTPRNLADFEVPAGEVATPVFNPAGGVILNPFVTVSISTTTPGATIHYTLDGSTPSNNSLQYTAPLNVTTTTTVKAIAYLGAQSSSVASATYTFPVSVASLADLRAQTVDSTIYRVSGQVQVVYQQSYRNQKFVQDYNAPTLRGILIDDFNGIITNTYQEGDVFTGLVGTLAEYGGMLELVPVANAGANLGNQPLIPLHVTLAQLNEPALYETYESRLIALDSVHFNDPGTFAAGTVYPISSPIASFNFRSSFYDADYIGQPIPAGVGYFMGIANSRTDGSFFSSRRLSDFVLYQPLANVNASSPASGVVDLNWSWTPGAPPDYVIGYEIYRDGAELANINNPQQLSYTDNTSIPGTTYTYGIAVLCSDSYVMDPVTVQITATSNDDPSSPVLTTALGSVYPNPFRAQTVINYSIKDGSPVTLGIYNVKGQLVRSLVNGSKAAGNYSVSWDGRADNGLPVSSGIYFYKMNAGKYSSTRKVIMMK